VSAVNSYGAAPHRILLDPETRIAAIDAQLASDLGYDPSELLDLPFSHPVSPDHITDLGNDLVQLVAGERDIVTARRSLATADSGRIDAVLSAEARSSNGRLVGFSVAVLIDDDDLALPATLPDHLRRLGAAAALIDADGSLLDTNLAWGQLFATAHAVTPGADMYALVHEDDREALTSRLAELARGAVSSLRSEQRCHAETGTFWCRLSIASFDSRANYFTVTADDISTEHLTNRVLLANEALFRSLAESSPVGLARLAPDLSITYSSPSWREITGESRDDPHLDMASLLHLSGRDEAIIELRQRIRTSSPEPVVARLAHARHNPAWASLRIGSVEDDELGLIGHVVTIEDVTGLVTINESKTQPAGIVESTSDLVGIADLRTGDIVYLNAAATELFAPNGLDGLSAVDM
jgi:PAS domain S-box-containing protein